MSIYRNTTGLLAAAVVLVSGCASMDEQGPQTSQTQPGMNVVDVTAVDRGPVKAAEEDMDSFGAVGQPPLYSSVQGAYKGRPLTKHIGDYVKNMTQDLIANMEFVNNKTPVGVTHFAMLDSNLQATNLMGQQMAESFVHELHKFRIPVIDFKATDYIRITDDGDFVLTRDYLELDEAMPIEYVLTGTMTKHQGGVLVNARILGMESRAVVATAQMLVPFYVVDALIPSNGNHRDGMRDGVKLSRG
ncbi:FlgO family outer membrane protein [Alteromonas sp. ASW11-19]|uniref:FlgO family outer membrane protein n=1 Tax=Alteromonas salexigens TaxID=2982530 RepID=A0ABT2VRK7_9ALTE|nr:FlgO family outer membrane protein [Alteromonas salexigens]MCU7555942.1 FlgO family outer membrane protein [Alteromonas salexigens]